MLKEIVLERDLQEAVSDCQAALNKAQMALCELHKLSDYPTPSTLADVTASGLMAFVAQRIEAVRGTTLYTEQQRGKIIDEWVEWRVKAMPHVAAVEAFANDWQVVSPVLDTATMTIYTSDPTEAITPLYTVAEPLQAHTHWHLINNVREAINELRAWEKEQDTCKLPIANLLQKSEEDVITSWVKGTIKVDHRHDDEGVKAWREAVEAATL